MDLHGAQKDHFKNHLADEKSPYLIQHAENPVDWYPWGDEAFEKAKKEDKPVFLSIGYATCHWCHVMAHESFEDAQVAEILNRHFVSIKVDREERPDIDHIYMSVCQAMTGSGGWPLSVFMTPEAKPFYSGTYFPKEGRLGMPGFIDLLTSIANSWRDKRSAIMEASKKITDSVSFDSNTPKGFAVLGNDTLKAGYEQLKKGFDKVHGGFGSSPKFPTPHQLTFLLRWHKRSREADALNMVEKTLYAMRRGGIFDQIGFGFHRYSVDPVWLVPHFEKMLYDQALLAMAYTEAYQVTGNNDFAKTSKEIFAYVLRDMTAPEGGFYSAEDADSEGKEGLFYVWKPEEIIGLLGKDLGELVCRFYDIREGGNFEEGYSIANIPVPMEKFAVKEGISASELRKTISSARERLFQARKKRIHPLKDDKVLTSWNGLMIAALAKGAQAFGEATYAEDAKRSADFILKTLKRADGRLLRRYRQGEVAHLAFLDDYAFFVWGLIELYEATFEVRWLEEAISLNNDMIDMFRDEKGGGFFFNGKGNEALITRTQEIYDGAIPSGNSIAALNLLRLSRMTGNTDLEQKADQLMQYFSNQVAYFPTAYTQFLSALDFVVGPGKEIVLVGDPATKTVQNILRTVQARFLPNKVVLFKHDGDQGQRFLAVAPFAKEMKALNSEATVYICEQYACKEPITDMDGLNEALGDISSTID